MPSNDSANARPAALVTGASYGVGAATALALAQAGCDLAITATRRANLEQTLSLLKAHAVRVVPLEFELSSPISIDAAFDAALAALGRVDVLVNNAGANLRKAAVEVTAQEWEALMAVNVTGPFLLSQRFARHLIAVDAPGSIVNVASTHGIVGAAERTTYGISKGALIQMTRMLAIEWAPHGIRVNAVAPGRLDTASPSRARSGSNADYMAAMLARIPLHRLPTVEEVAAAIAYLASPAAASVTGHTLVVDGGLTAA